MRWGWLSGVVLLLTGCPPAGSISGKVGSDGSGGSVAVAIPGEPIAPREAFETAFQSWVTGSVAADFDDARCSAVVTSFVDVAARTTGNKRWKALYNAAVARQRCGKHIEAKTLLAQIVGESPKFLRARVRLALYELEASGGKDTGKTIDGIRAALSDAQRDDGGAPDMSALSPADQVRHAELLVVEADRGAEDAIQRYEDAGNLYYRVWQTFGEEPCRAKAPECHGFDKILYNGARAFQAARIIGKAISLRKVLLDPQFGLHNGALGKIAPYEIGGIYQAIGEYDAAAEAYEQFAAEEAATQDKDMQEKASTALSDAVVLRLGLDQADKAVQDANRFSATFGARDAAKVAQIAFAIGASYAERQEWKAAEKVLSAAMAKIDRDAPIDVKLQAHAVLARSLAAMAKPSDAESEYAVVRDSWKDPDAIAHQIAKNDGNADRRLGKALTSAGEALFFFAEKERAKLELIKFPVLKGNHDEKAIAAFIGGKLKEWLEAKQDAIRSAEAHYLKIIELRPAPPPRWVVDAGEAVGAMWAGLVDDVMKAPYPKDWDKDGAIPGITPPMQWHALRDHYLATLAQVMEAGPKARAKQAYQSCLAYSVKFQYFDKHASACRSWLVKNAPAELEPVDELYDRQGRPTSALAQPAELLGYDGGTLLEGRAEALVLVASLAMQRRNEVADDGGKDDLTRARADLQRALAIDDSYLPAFNQLALYYLAGAKQREQAQRHQALSLASLVCSQAIRKSPSYAPIHNTLGLVALEQGDRPLAAQSFAVARRADPRSFEARMNFAALNLELGGAREAEEAYREALALAPKSYEAQLGLAAALHGQIDDGKRAPQIEMIDRAIAAAKAIDPERPEAYFNDALITDRIKAAGRAGPALAQAKELYQTFVAKAAGKDGYAAAIARANERIAAIDALPPP